ncbi:NUDIX domain-containing protein [Candidatus Micrarchaeota archaeon]|nr:NUDIX domain-containing protein [Candidatus Micrarchaeota archaeon]
MADEYSAGAIIFRKNKYLVLQYEEGHWDLVKGHIEKDESEKETVVRETAEETGICNLIFVDGFRERIEYKYPREEKISHKEVIFLLAETKTEKIMLSSEHIGYKWLSFDDAMKRMTYENAKTVLKKANDFLKKAKS